MSPLRIFIAGLCLLTGILRADPAPALLALPGVIRVAVSDQRGTVGALEVETERGTDIRRDIAKTIVTRGWGLLEMRPMRMSLEEVFLQVTTEERPPEAGTVGPADPGTLGPPEDGTLGPSGGAHE